MDSVRTSHSPRHHRVAPLSALLTATVALLGLATPAAAASIYLNGVKINGVTNKEFRGADVRIDSTGDVHIEAKGYEVRRQDGEGSGATAGTPVSETYYLIATETKPGKVQWDVDVFVGGKLAATVAWNGGQVIKDISSFLVAGDNTIHFRAKRNLSQPRMSFSPGDKLKILIGTGSQQGNSVVITRPLVTFIRTGAEDAPVDRDELLKAR